ncbi:glycine zipper 2TM domain-containing protein [Thiomonas intermedia]|uniref:glycine zipper 2TM domain-containing protein n=1 Tax=Thiomonas intermedia TaxID=926 RepID=UPI0009A4D7FE|nr:glycine zipper 2TM domain-containing protein [Thiomonas intermedia]
MSSIPPQNATTPGKGVWIAVFVMGAVIVALLAAVLYKLSDSSGGKPVAAASAVTAPTSTALASAPQAASAPPTQTQSTAAATVPATQTAETKNTAPPSTAQTQAAAPQPKPVVRQAQASEQAAPQQFAPQQFAPQTAPVAPQQPVCSHCGTVAAVTPVQVHSQQNSPVGVIAGGIVGGLLGNQVGGGDGRKLATVAGAIGGGFAGNEIAKRVDSQTVYDVQVRMDDGQVRTLQLKVAPPVGQRVQLGSDGGLNPIP